MPKLGYLQLYYDHTTSEPLRALLVRMAEIDGNISKSAYDTTILDTQDRSPTGDDYNLLWNAILDVLQLD